MPELQNLPQPNSPMPVPIELYWGDSDKAERDTDRTSAPLAHYLWVLRRQASKIAALVAIVVISTYIVSKRIMPIYESTVTIAIDRQTPTDVVGQDSTRAIVTDSDQFLADSGKTDSNRTR